MRTITKNTTRSKTAKPKATSYDVAEHLRTPQEMAAYLDAWLEDAPDDVSGIARALGDIARAKGMAQVAGDAGLSRESLYRALSKDGNPSFATVLKVAQPKRPGAVESSHGKPITTRTLVARAGCASPGAGRIWSDPGTG